ncbi:hypothetical protein OS493_030472 [Desmophyllum pertusum]|uniref:Uncharacterized protein n=1 Tax=Desmophyllum pertusum TaxID=174260 RepID=A0A9W9YWL5_9CNID|nr:hypothetical protein OS493_030472 [Desmophyllum pertusum]
MDGADCNRQFIKLHFHDKDPAEDKFVTYNIYTGTPMVFMMDPKGVWKSSLFKDKKGKRLRGNYSKMPINWDQASCSLPVHEKLTTQHFQLDPASKMRNHLAEDVLDHKMLFLIQKYQEDINDRGKDGSEIEATICLLKHTSNLIEFLMIKCQ